MRIIISPAKKMNQNTDDINISGMPVFMEDSKYLMNTIKGLTCQEAKALWKCNDKLAQLNYERFRIMDPESARTPALLSYEGLQYQHIAPRVLEYRQWDYLQQHLRILSGFYGLLKPLDGVTPYRLEMQARLAVRGAKNLYEFWGRKICDELTRESDTIINLASKEYSKSVEPYLTDAVNYITCIFGEYIDGKVIEKGTLAKMARGETVRFMAEHNVKNPEQLMELNCLGFQYEASLSDPQHYVFLRQGQS